MDDKIEIGQALNESLKKITVDKTVDKPKNEAEKTKKRTFRMLRKPAI